MLNRYRQTHVGPASLEPFRQCARWGEIHDILQRPPLFSALQELVARDGLVELVVVSVLPTLETIEDVCEAAEVVSFVDVLDSTEPVTLVELRESMELVTLAG